MLFVISSLPSKIGQFWSSRKGGKTRKRGMALSALSSTDSQTDSHLSQAPRWGAWTACLIIVSFYLTQAAGMFMVHMVATLGVSGLAGLGEASTLAQTWVLPLSLALGTMGGAMVAWQVATSRAKPPLDLDWLFELLGKSYDLRNLWRFMAMGLSLGLGFFALTEYGVLPSDDLPQPLFDAMNQASLLLQIGWVLMFVLLFPLVEEVVFRGFFFTGLSQSWGQMVAGVLTTLVFVAVHMPKVLEYWPAFVAVTLIGTLTVLLRIRSGNLAPGIVMHSTYNGTLVAAAFLTQPAS